MRDTTKVGIVISLTMIAVVLIMMYLSLSKCLAFP